MKTEQIVKEYKTIAKEYAYDPDVMCEDDGRMRAIKKIINTRLSLADRTIILLYAELMSYRKLGEMMNLSHMTIRREVQRIAAIIKQELKDNGNVH